MLKSKRIILTSQQNSAAELNKMLVNTLVQKIKHKYKIFTGADQLIWKKVAQFIYHDNKNRPLTEHSLRILDKEIHSAIHTPCKTPALLNTPKEGKAKENLNRPNTSRNPTRKEMQLELRKQRTLLANTHRSEDFQEFEEEKEWAKIVQFNAKLHEEAIKQEKDQKRKQKIAVRNALLQQMKEKEMLKAQQNSEEKNYASIENSDLNKWLDGEKMRRELLKTAQMTRRQELFRQSFETRKRKILDKKYDRTIENQILNENKRKMELEAQEKLERKEREKEFMWENIEGSEFKRTWSKTQSMKNNEFEKNELAEFIKKMEENENERINERKRRILENEKIVRQAWEKAASAKDLIRKSENEWDKKVNQLELLKYYESEQNRKNAIKNQQTSMQRYYEAQLEYKRNMEMQEKVEKEKENEQIKKNIEAYEKERDRNKMLLKKTCINNAEYLKKQVAKLGKSMSKSKTFAYFYGRKPSEY